MIFIGLSVCCVAMVLYPYFVYPILLRCLPRRPLQAKRPDVLDPPRLALLFCAYNEESVIEEKIANLEALKRRYPELAIAAYNDASSDRTASYLRAVPTLLKFHDGTRRIGKAQGMQRLVDATDADVLVFTDANVLIDEDAIDRLLDYFRREDVGAVAGTLEYVNRDASDAAFVGSRYWQLEEGIKRLESHTGSTIGADGSLFAIRRRLYPSVPPHLLDDFIVSMAPIFEGYRVISAPDVRALERSVTAGPEEFARKRRIGCRAFATHLHLWPLIRRQGPTFVFKYVSHKFVRWTSSIALLFGAAFAAIGVSLVLGAVPTVLLATAGVASLVAGWRAGVRSIHRLMHVLLAILATGLGVWEALRGKRYQTWEPAQTRS